MAARYPDLAPQFFTKVNLTSLVNAIDVNVLYEEVSAITSIVGLQPHKRAGNWGDGTFNSGTLDYGTVNDRIRNVENGTYRVYNDYVSKSGGTTIRPAGTGTVNLTLQTQTSQTAALFEAKNSDGTTTLASLSAAGVFRAVTIDGGSA